MAGSTFCAVPVLPATLYPGTAAALPVPSSTTPVSISSMVRAVCSEITRRTTTGSIRRTNVPSCVRRPRTTWGRIRVPPFARAAKAVANWTGVTDTSCPIDSTESERPDHPLGRRIIPGVSPGRSTPVRLPKPNPLM